MILFISHHGESLPIALRMLQEGTDCGVYIHDQDYRSSYAGILERVSLADLKKAARVSDTIIFDGVRPNLGTINDKALLKMFGISGNPSVVFGPVANALMKDHQVIGCSKATERLMIEELWARQGQHRDGLIHEGWFDGEKWAFFSAILEHRSFMNAGYGPMLGCQQTTVTILKEQPRVFHDIGDVLMDCRYKGPVSCSKGSVISLHFRFDSLYALLELYTGRLEDFFTSYFSPDFIKGFASTERVTIPPYPYRNAELLHLAKNTQIEGSIQNYPSIWFQDVHVNGHGFACAGNDGIIGIATGKGKNINAAWSKCYKAVDGLRIKGEIQIRTDGPRMAEKTLKRAMREGSI